MRGRDRSRATICSIGAAHDYAGIGPGAHSRIGANGTKRALAAIKSPEGWLAEVEASGHGLASDEVLSAEQAADEYLLMGLRLSEGIDLARLAAIDGRVLAEDARRRAGAGRPHRPQRHTACRHAQRAARARPADRRACGLKLNKTRRWRRSSARGRSLAGRLRALREWRGRARRFRRRAGGTVHRRRKSRSAG